MKNKDLPINAIPKDRDIDAMSKNGLTKREYFAGLAMQGILSNPNTRVSNNTLDEIIIHSLESADRILKKLEK